MDTPVDSTDALLQTKLFQTLAASEVESSAETLAPLPPLPRLGARARGTGSLHGLVCRLAGSPADNQEPPLESWNSFPGDPEKQELGGS